MAPLKKLQELLDTFRLVEGRSERIDLLISLADHYKAAPETIAPRPLPESARVPHCESEAFVFAEPLAGGTLKFHFVVENPQGISAMATAVILDKCLSGEPLESVIALDPGVIYEIFGQELSTGKGLGLTAIVSMVQSLARRALRR